MTPKELLYMEDALGMEQQLKVKCYEYATKVQDSELKNMITGLSRSHQQHFDDLIGQL
ncbi:MAG: hypothetical protein LBR74_02870 [Eubacterium sp.]|nr:hypothetical protein [Eubacterium sp.]